MHTTRKKGNYMSVLLCMCEAGTARAQGGWGYA